MERVDWSTLDVVGSASCVLDELVAANQVGMETDLPGMEVKPKTGQNSCSGCFHNS